MYLSAIGCTIFWYCPGSRTLESNVCDTSFIPIPGDKTENMGRVKVAMKLRECEGAPLSIETMKVKENRDPLNSSLRYRAKIHKGKPHRVGVIEGEEKG